MARARTSGAHAVFGLLESSVCLCAKWYAAWDFTCVQAHRMQREWRYLLFSLSASRSLLADPFPPPSPPPPSLSQHLAAANGHDIVVTFLLLEGADVNCRDNFGTTPLLEALRAGHDSTAKLLKDKGATVDLQVGREGWEGPPRVGEGGG